MGTLQLGDAIQIHAWILVFACSLHSAPVRAHSDIPVEIQMPNGGRPAKGYWRSQVLLPGTIADSTLIDHPILRVWEEGMFGAPSDVRILATPQAAHEVCQQFFNPKFKAVAQETESQAPNQLGFGIVAFNSRKQRWVYKTGPAQEDVINQKVKWPSVLRTVSCAPE